MSKPSEMTISHVIEQNLNLPLESYSPRPLCIINHGLKSCSGTPSYLALKMGLEPRRDTRNANKKAGKNYYCKRPALPEKHQMTSILINNGQQVKIPTGQCQALADCVASGVATTLEYRKRYTDYEDFARKCNF